MYGFLLVLAILVFSMLKYRETFVVKYGNPINDEDLISFDKSAVGSQVFAWTPDTCPTNKPELDAGLCYEPCEEGYHGVGPVCWASSQNVGIGTIPDLKFRAEQRTSWGSVGCTGGRRFRFQGYNDCYNVTIQVPYQECKDNRENVVGLCYRRCPKELPNRVPGMPYLCFKGTRGLSYGRGVGDVPPLYSFGE